MRYIYEIRRPKRDSYTEYEWVEWTVGDLQDCLEDFFRHQGEPISGMVASRITWQRPPESM
jgi:hypothetical protein